MIQAPLPDGPSPPPSGHDATLDHLFAALASARRRKVLRAVGDGRSTGTALAAALKWRRDDVAKQITELKAAGLVVGRREGRDVRLTLQGDPIVAAKGWVAAIRASEPSSATLFKESDVRDAVAAALRNAGRRRLLTYVRGAGDHSQVAIRRACGVEQALASRGLAQLEAAGLLSSARAGKAKRYVADFGAIEGLWAWLTVIENHVLQGHANALETKSHERPADAVHPAIADHEHAPPDAHAIAPEANE